MKKSITLINNDLIIDVGSLKKSHIKSWVAICNSNGDRIGGFSLSDKKLKVIDKYKGYSGCLYLLYAIEDR